MPDNLSDSEKLSHIYLILTDDKIGLCGRVKELEHTVNGNGSIGIAEKVRNLDANWKAMTAGITVVVSVIIHIIQQKFGK